MQNLSVEGKKVVLRVDLNVPMINGKIEDDTRIVKILPTIKYLTEHKAKIIIISHFGRPKGRIVKEMSLEPIAKYLQVKFVDTNPQDAIAKMQNGDVICLENLRFNPGEEANDGNFAKELASYGDIYINDAFSCSHRSHASIVGIAKLLPGAAGLLLQEELLNLEKILSAPSHPMAAIVGGSKISTKLNLLYHLIKKADLLVVGGAMANSFLKASGYDVGKSLYEADLIDVAKDIIAKAHENNCKLILPIDVVISSSINDSNSKIVNATDVDANSMILDLGPKTIAIVTSELQKIKTLVWNGPLGAFEYKPFDQGTINLAKEVSRLTISKQLISVAGGGDIVSALTAAGVVDDFSYISTAGGAFLEWLEGMNLPGIEVLQNDI
ncbi:Phosphoglycerate kinase [Candidatus Arcanobacter lacustris]|uniref:Phosphoglycerate kinase n=1 Tax=Candidatus Arcanibacter lacustris TaxID=1607817 RepID=A0A0F5MNX8_9RICK|nr:Phosphoglycerate kinase [Candidatus Arcanobacter lacustris]